MNPERCIAMARVFLELEQVPTLASAQQSATRHISAFFQVKDITIYQARNFTKTRPFHVDRRGKNGILAHTDPKGDMPEDTPTDA